MTNRSLAQSAHPTTRHERGTKLCRERGDEIEHLDGYRWSVPSCSGDHRYITDLRHQSCTCNDAIWTGRGCKHLHAATIARAKSDECGGCGVRVRRRDLHSVPEDHPTLGGLVDELCEPCARSQGTL